MEQEGWYLKPYASFIFLLDRYVGQGKDTLQKRFKKDKEGLINLYILLQLIDSFGYDEGVAFGFSTERLKPIKNTWLHLIEMRRFHKTWRIITYLDTERKRLIMIDAFEAHKSKSLDKKVREIEPLIKIAVELSSREDE